jgi:hypothetical protein
VDRSSMKRPAASRSRSGRREGKQKGAFPVVEESPEIIGGLEELHYSVRGLRPEWTPYPHHRMAPGA